jgi:HB1/ASXL restriction endonuclease-like protein with HTH domain
MSTLVVVEEVLRERGTPMVVREIVVAAAERLPTKSKTPDTVVARDLAMDIKKHGPDSRFARVAPGLYTLRELAPAFQVAPVVLDAAGAPVELLTVGVLEPSSSSEAQS